MTDELYINHLICYPRYLIFYSYLRRNGKKETSTTNKIKNKSKGNASQYLNFCFWLWGDFEQKTKT